MIVGVPKEIKQDEYRVALLPVGVEELVRAGHRVLVEALPPVARAINLYRGEVTNRAVAETFQMPYNNRFEV